MTETRYQVFISSTYLDLVEPRREVQQAVLELDCIPAGMELFVASDESQWELIREVIDLSDYYVLIVAGRYGSINEETGVSYTEMEFDYAVETNKHILAFVHSDPDRIYAGDSELSETARAKLEEFRQKVTTGRHVSLYESDGELKAKVVTALNRATRKSPGIGWVRGDRASTREQQEERVARKEELASIKREQATAESEDDRSNLSQGDETVRIGASIEHGYYSKRTTNSVRVDLTWDQVFAALGPMMINEESEHKLRERLAVEVILKDSRNDKKLPNYNDLINRKISCNSRDWDGVLVQFLALKLIEKGKKNRGVKDTDKYFGLTPRGEDHLIYLRATRSTPTPSSDRSTAQAGLGGDYRDDKDGTKAPAAAGSSE